MSNEPLVSVGSNNRIGNRNVIIVAVIPTVAVVTIATIAIWPYLHAIGLALELLALTLVCCLAVAAIAGLIYLCYRFRLHLQHLDRQSRLLTWSDGAAWHAVDGEMLHLSAQHEAAKGQKLLPAQVSVKEVAEQDREVDELQILALAEQGKSIRAIEKETGFPYQRVRETVNAWKEKHGFI